MEVVNAPTFTGMWGFNSVAIQNTSRGLDRARCVFVNDDCIRAEGLELVELLVVVAQQ
jgi:hypothetical protein